MRRTTFPKVTPEQARQLAKAGKRFIERNKEYINAGGEIIEKGAEVLTTTNQDIAREVIDNFNDRRESAWEKNYTASQSLKRKDQQLQRAQERLKGEDSKLSPKERESLEKDIKDYERQVRDATYKKAEALSEMNDLNKELDKVREQNSRLPLSERNRNEYLINSAEKELNVENDFKENVPDNLKDQVAENSRVPEEKLRGKKSEEGSTKEGQSSPEKAPSDNDESPTSSNEEASTSPPSEPSDTTSEPDNTPAPNSLAQESIDVFKTKDRGFTQAMKDTINQMIGRNTTQENTQQTKTDKIVSQNEGWSEIEASKAANDVHISHQNPSINDAEQKASINKTLNSGKRIAQALAAEAMPDGHSEHTAKARNAMQQAISRTMLELNTTNPDEIAQMVNMREDILPDRTLHPGKNAHNDAEFKAITTRVRSRLQSAFSNKTGEDGGDIIKQEVQKSFNKLSFDAPVSHAEENGKLANMFNSQKPSMTMNNVANKFKRYPHYNRKTSVNW